MRRARTIPKHEITAAQRSAQGLAFLYGCRPSVLAAQTVPDLASRYGWSAKVAEYELTIARQKRAAEA